MNEKYNHRKTGLELFDAMNSAEFSQLQDCIDDDVEFDFPGVERIKGKKKVLVFLKVLLRKYKNLTFTVNDVLEGENKMVVIWTNKGNDALGAEYSNSGVSLFHFTPEGRINFLSDYFKDTSFAND